MFVKELLSENIYECVFDESGLVILVFYTRKFKPSNEFIEQLSKLSSVYKNKIKVYKVDFEVHKELIKIFEIVSLPTLIMFKGGCEKHRFTGTVTNQQIEVFISMLN